MIEYDPVKDAENIAKHGLALIGATRLFEGPFIEEEDGRFDYDETRFVAIGPVSSLADRICVAVYTWRDGKRRVISFRKANDREIRKYRSSHA